MTLKELLETKMTKKQLALVPSSFDIIGSKEKAVAVIDIPKELNKKQNLIGKALMQKHKNVKTVLMKVSKRKGLYRLTSCKIIAGSRNTVVIHKESGCRFMLDPCKVYFSPRESTERMRLAKEIQKNEAVMIFFAGAGPLAVIIGKHAKPEKIIGIEINKKAVEFYKKNAVLNKIDSEIVCGDVKTKAKHFYEKCDRVIMPLPEKAIDFVPFALKCLKRNGVCHFYCFSKQEDISNVKKALKKIAGKEKRKIQFLSVNKVLPYSPGVWKTRIDFKVIK